MNLCNHMNGKKELKIITKLCNRLNTDGISYCHWKSNNAIDRSASGENDLDLLVSRADIRSFIEILSQLDFKQAGERWRQPIPGISDYYGFDQESGILVHVHAHSQLILGHDATKNFHIPIEEAYLASSSVNGLFKIPAAEFELIILIIRLIIKHSTWDAVLLGYGHLSKSEKDEINFLLSQTNEDRINDVLRNHFPYIQIQQFSECLKTLTSTFSVLENLRVGQRLIKSLRQFARFSPAKDTFIKFWQRIYWPVRRRIQRIDMRKQMCSGGLMIAIVGGDGSGKTTVVKEIFLWLSDIFSVYGFHMGKPKWSLQTIIIRGILKIGRSLGFYPFERVEDQYTNDPDSLIFPGYPSLIRALCTAHDRYQTFIRARTLSTNGALVILDRFPLMQLKFMDGPHIRYITANHPRNGIIKYLINMEESYYQKMALPDLLIVLRADPEIAVKRKTEETEYSVRARTTEIWKMDWDKTTACVINANLTKEEVEQTVKNLLWTRL